MCKNIFEFKRPFVLNHHCYNYSIGPPLVEVFAASLSSIYGQPQFYCPFQEDGHARKQIT